MTRHHHPLNTNTPDQEAARIFEAILKRHAQEIPSCQWEIDWFRKLPKKTRRSRAKINNRLANPVEGDKPLCAKFFLDLERTPIHHLDSSHDGQDLSHYPESSHSSASPEQHPAVAEKVPDSLADLTQFLPSQEASSSNHVQPESPRGKPAPRTAPTLQLPGAYRESVQSFHPESSVDDLGHSGQLVDEGYTGIPSSTPALATSSFPPSCDSPKSEYGDLEAIPPATALSSAPVDNSLAHTSAPDPTLMSQTLLGPRSPVSQTDLIHESHGEAVDEKQPRIITSAGDEIPYSSGPYRLPGAFMSSIHSTTPGVSTDDLALHPSDEMHTPTSATADVPEPWNEASVPEVTEPTSPMADPKFAERSRTPTNAVELAPEVEDCPITPTADQPGVSLPPPSVPRQTLKVPGAYEPSILSPISSIADTSIQNSPSNLTPERLAPADSRHEAPAASPSTAEPDLTPMSHSDAGAGLSTSSPSLATLEVNPPAASQEIPQTSERPVLVEGVSDTTERDVSVPEAPASDPSHVQPALENNNSGASPAPTPKLPGAYLASTTSLPDFNGEATVPSIVLNSGLEIDNTPTHIPSPHQTSVSQPSLYRPRSPGIQTALPTDGRPAQVAAGDGSLEAATPAGDAMPFSPSPYRLPGLLLSNPASVHSLTPGVSTEDLTTRPQDDLHTPTSTSGPAAYSEHEPRPSHEPDTIDDAKPVDSVANLESAEPSPTPLKISSLAPSDETEDSPVTPTAQRPSVVLPPPSAPRQTLKVPGAYEPSILSPISSAAEASVQNSPSNLGPEGLIPADLHDAPVASPSPLAAEPSVSLPQSTFEERAASDLDGGLPTTELSDLEPSTTLDDVVHALEQQMTLTTESAQDQLSSKLGSEESLAKIAEVTQDYQNVNTEGAETEHQDNDTKSDLEVDRNAGKSKAETPQPGQATTSIPSGDYPGHSGLGPHHPTGELKSAIVVSTVHEDRPATTQIEEEPVLEADPVSGHAVNLQTPDASNASSASQPTEQAPEHALNVLEADAHVDEVQDQDPTPETSDSATNENIVEAVGAPEVIQENPVTPGNANDVPQTRPDDDIEEITTAPVPDATASNSSPITVENKSKPEAEAASPMVIGPEILPPSTHDPEAVHSTDEVADVVPQPSLELFKEQETSAPLGDSPTQISDEVVVDRQDALAEDSDFAMRQPEPKLDVISSEHVSGSALGATNVEVGSAVAQLSSRPAKAQDESASTANPQNVEIEIPASETQLLSESQTPEPPSPSPSSKMPVESATVKKANELSKAADELSRSFGTFGDIDDLDTAIELYGQAAELLAPSPDILDVSSYLNLGRMMRVKFEAFCNIPDLEAAIDDSLLKALGLITPEHESYTDVLYELGAAFSDRYIYDGSKEAGARAEDYCNQALKYAKGSKEALIDCVLSRLHLARFENLAQAVDAEKAVEYLTHASNADAALANQGKYLDDLARALFARAKVRSEPAKSIDLAECLELAEAACQRIPEETIQYPIASTFLAEVLLSRYKGSNDTADLGRAIDLLEEAVKEVPYVSPEQPWIGERLGLGLLARFEREGLAEDLDDGISFLEISVNLTLSNQYRRRDRLREFRSALMVRFVRSRALEDQEKADNVLREIEGITGALDLM